MQSNNKNKNVIFLWIAIGVCFFLLLPFIAMQLSAEVDWQVFGIATLYLWAELAVSVFF